MTGGSGSRRNGERRKDQGRWDHGEYWSGNREYPFYAGRPDVPGTVLHALGKQNINIEFVVHNIDIEGNGNMIFCIDQKNLEISLRSFRGIKPLIEAKGISYHPDVAVISVFGPHFRERPMISGLMFNALGTAGIMSWRSAPRSPVAPV